MNRTTQLSLVTAMLLGMDGAFATEPKIARDAITDTASSALTVVEREVYSNEYEEITFNKILPVHDMKDPFATSLEYNYVNSTGKAKLASEVGQISWIDAFIGTKSIPLHDGNIGYKYGIKELGRAGRMGVPLDSLKAQESMASALRLAQEIAYFGDATRGITGFYNNPDVPEITVSGGVAWSGKSPENILLDINNLFGTAYANSKLVEFKPESQLNRLILPVDLWTLLNSKIINTVTGETVLDYVIRNSKWIKKSEHVIASPDIASDTVRIYQYDKKKVCFYWGSMPKFLAPQHKDLTLTVAGSFSIGGTVTRKPQSQYDLIGA
jgi:hypothetical protein